jgi:hypothetical protein
MRGQTGRPMEAHENDRAELMPPGGRGGGPLLCRVDRTSTVGHFCYDSRMSLPSHSSSFAEIMPSALDLIGNTPLVALDRIEPGPGRILAKAEFMQPGGSVKDRPARAILLTARADGRLVAGAPVVEMTSGNIGGGPCRRVRSAGAPTRGHHVRQEQPAARADAWSARCRSCSGASGRRHAGTGNGRR